MGDFLTEKKIERLLEFETRYLSIPEGVATSSGRPITVFKKRPLTLFVGVWDMYDLLVEDRPHLYNPGERTRIYKPRDLIFDAAKNAFNSKSHIDACLHKEVAERFQSYRALNLPVLQETNAMLAELIPLYREDDEDYEEKQSYAGIYERISAWIEDLSSKYYLPPIPALT